MKGYIQNLFVNYDLLMVQLLYQHASILFQTLGSMARKRDRETDLFSCDICHEDGDNSPFRCPYGHVVCVICYAKQIVEKNKLAAMCLVCGKKRRVDAQIRLEKKNDAAEKTHDNGKASNKKCHKHGKELGLFCFEDTCRVPICLSCLGDHKKHEINEIETKEKEFLTRKLKRVKMDLETEVERFSKANNDVTNKGNRHIQHLRKAKEAFIQYIQKRFDQMIEDTKYQCNQFEKRVKEEVSAMRTKIELADDIEEQRKQVDGTNNEKIQYYCETVRDDIENHKPNLTGLR